MPILIRGSGGASAGGAAAYGVGLQLVSQLPAAGAANTIYIVGAVPVGDVYTTPVQPAAAGYGDVWLDTSVITQADGATVAPPDAIRFEFASAQVDSYELYVRAPRQFVDDVWELPEAYVWQAGSWVTWKNYGFNYTGEWDWYNPERTILRLKTSGIFVPLASHNLKVFLVGGGGAGTAKCGGGGGYTVTGLASVSAGLEYKVTIGDGGEGCDETVRVSAFGKATEAFGLSAAGGEADVTKGGNGGSGGGGGGAFNLVAIGSSPTGKSGAGGSNGGNGGQGLNADTYSGLLGGTGQGTTTRAFGSSSGELFAGGGGGAAGRDLQNYGGAGGEGGGGAGSFAYIYIDPLPGEPNTGGGGGAGGYTGAYVDNKPVYNYRTGANGGSGVVLIDFYAS